jgi:Zn-dependent alcohol dehydrogenase
MFVVIGLGATLNVAKPQKGSSVAIFGLGAVGLAVRSFFARLNMILSPLLQLLMQKLHTVM